VNPRRTTRLAAESESKRLLRRPLSRMTKLSSLCDAVLRKHLRRLEDEAATQSGALASALLLSRVADDLRAATLCASLGYVPQALTLAASVYELAYLASYVARDENRAKKWLAWPSAATQPWKRKEIVLDALQAAYEAGAVPETKSEENFYSALCWVKHGNPRTQSEFTPLATGEAQIIHAHPEISPETPRRAVIALWLAIRPIMVTLVGLHRSGKVEPELTTDIIKIRDEWIFHDDRIRAALDEAPN
jgi:hypothetical protein